VAALVRDYSIAADRLEAHGVGPLSPDKTNESEDGRSRNRRVEMVER
jgi:outer membrane protein OmpA-like peptidoglycan-associated protein